MLLDQIQSDLAVAQKARDQIKVDCLRFLLGAAFNLQIEKGKDYALTDNDILNVISKQVKTHKESIEMFGQAKRDDLVVKETAELAILQAYLPVRQAGLPEQMSEEAVKLQVSVIREKNPQADFPTLIKLAMGELKGKADGALVAKLVKEIVGV